MREILYDRHRLWWWEPGRVDWVCDCIVSSFFLLFLCCGIRVLWLMCVGERNVSLISLLFFLFCSDRLGVCSFSCSVCLVFSVLFPFFELSLILSQLLQDVYNRIVLRAKKWTTKQKITRHPTKKEHTLETPEHRRRRVMWHITLGPSRVVGVVLVLVLFFFSVFVFWCRVRVLWLVRVERMDGCLYLSALFLSLFPLFRSSRCSFFFFGLSFFSSDLSPS